MQIKGGNKIKYCYIFNSIVIFGKYLQSYLIYKQMLRYFFEISKNTVSTKIATALWFIAHKI